MNNKDKIINICREIRDKNKCNGCGGNFNNYTCRYCGSDNLDLKTLIEELNSCLLSLNDVDNDILMALFSIKRLNILFVNDLLDKYNYTNYLGDWYSDILYRTSIDKLGKMDYKYIIYFLDNKFFLGDNRNKYINLLMKKLLTGELDLSIEEIFILIENFVLMFMKVKVNNPRCVFEKLDDNVLGESFWNVISLDKDKIIKIINQKSYVRLLDLIFHECSHTYQNFILTVDKEISYVTLLMAKETLIRKKVPSYYDENYVKYSAEVDARWSGAFFTKQYLECLGLKVVDSTYFDKVMGVELERFFDETRVLNGVDTTVDEVFSMCINDANCLDRYPVLSVQYKNNNGKLEKKTIEEIMYDYEMYKSGKLKLVGKGNSIDMLYNYLLGGYKNKGNGM